MWDAKSGFIKTLFGKKKTVGTKDHGHEKTTKHTPKARKSASYLESWRIWEMSQFGISFFLIWTLEKLIADWATWWVLTLTSVGTYALEAAWNCLNWGE